MLGNSVKRGWKGGGSVDMAVGSVKNRTCVG
jgi:hypothetical protein